MLHTAQRLRQALLRRCGGAPVVLPVAVVLHALVVALVDQVVVHQSLAVLPSCFTAGWFWWTVGLMALFTGLLTFFTRTILPGPSSPPWPPPSWCFPATSRPSSPRCR